MERPNDGGKGQMFQVQQQIRANASELQEYFSDLYKWEKSIGLQEENRQKKSSKASATMPAVRRQVHLHSITSGNNHSKAPSEHVYDKGYAKWEKFDVDAALQQVDNDGPHAEQPLQPPAAPTPSAPPAKKSPLDTRPRDEIEREEGNAHYKRGDYVAAIKCYTKSLGYNPRNAIVLSNRAMAYLKNREYKKAEEDCTLALTIDAKHVKSLCRRATARNALGKHRLALLDLTQAKFLEPQNRQVDSQLASTKESMKSCLKRAPKRAEVPIQVIPSEERQEVRSFKSNISPTEPPRVKNRIPHIKRLDDKENMSQNQPASGEGHIAEAGKGSLTPSMERKKSKAKTSTLASLKLPKKAPTTSYELNRVWRTIKTNRKAAVQNTELLGLQSNYLQLIPPTSLASIFKNSIEAELLCDFFHVFRHETVAKNPQFVVEFLEQLPRVPRFEMVVMFLSGEDKQDIAWIFDKLLSGATLPSTVTAHQLEQLKKKYEL